MSVLAAGDRIHSASPLAHAAFSRAFPVCSNPCCSSGWLNVWRRRGVPALEGGWLCSPACTRARMEGLLRREQTEWRPIPEHRHRVPIGLILLHRGWITHEQLRNALKAQRKGANMRIGEWLVANCALDEARLTQALGLQWSCPVFSLGKQGAGAPVTLLPRLLSDSFGFVPLRLSPSGILYLAFEDRIDHSLTLAIERMTGLRVESGLLSGSDFREARERHTQARFARARLIEAGSLSLLAESFTRCVEKARPADARLVRLHDLFWLRMRWGSENPASNPASKPVSNPVSNPARDTKFEDILGSVVRFTGSHTPASRFGVSP